MDDRVVAGQLCSRIIRLVDVPPENETGCAGLHRALCLPVSILRLVSFRPTSNKERNGASSNHRPKWFHAAGVDALDEIGSDLSCDATVQGQELRIGLMFGIGSLARTAGLDHQRDTPFLARACYSRISLDLHFLAFGVFIPDVKIRHYPSAPAASTSSIRASPTVAPSR